MHSLPWGVIASRPFQCPRLCKSLIQSIFVFQKFYRYNAKVDVLQRLRTTGIVGPCLGSLYSSSLKSSRIFHTLSPILSTSERMGFRRLGSVPSSAVDCAAEWADWPVVLISEMWSWGSGEILCVSSASWRTGCELGCVTKESFVQCWSICWSRRDLATL